MPYDTSVNDTLGHNSHIDYYIVSDNVQYSIDEMQVSPNVIIVIISLFTHCNKNNGTI